DGLTIVAVDGNGVPSEGRESTRHVVREGDVGGTIDGDLVVVVEVYEATEAEVAGDRRRLRADPLHEVPVGYEPVGVMIDEVDAEPGTQVRLGDRHSHPGAESLPEWPGGHLDAQVVVDLGVACGVAPPL